MTAVVRCAAFVGWVTPGQEAAFEALVRDTLAPLWAAFPGATEVRLLSPTAADEGAPPVHMVLQTRYPDRATLEAALASPVRERTREPSQRLLAMFEGRVIHYTAAYTDLPPPRSPGAPDLD